MDTDESHPCIIPGCTNIVGFDDEPWCYTHSPDSGSDVQGYSYKASVFLQRQDYKHRTTDE